MICTNSDKMFDPISCAIRIKFAFLHFMYLCYRMNTNISPSNFLLNFTKSLPILQCLVDLQVGFFDGNSYYIFEFVLVEIDPTTYVIRIEAKYSSFRNRQKLFCMYVFSNCTILFACLIQLDSIKDKVGKYSIPNHVLTYLCNYFVLLGDFKGKSYKWIFLRGF